LREHVLHGHLDELGIGAVVGASENLPVRPGGVLACAPAEPRVDDDLLAGVPANARPVRAGDQGQIELVRGARRGAEEQIAAGDRSGTELDDHLAGAGDRIVDVLVRQNAGFPDQDGFHRTDTQGTSAETSPATYPPSPTDGASTTLR